MDFEKTYAKLPWWMQNWAVSAEGMRIQLDRYGGDFHKLLRDAEDRTYWSVEDTCAFRDGRLRSFVRHCYETVAFYKKRFKGIGLHPDDILTIQDLKHLPVLEKKEAQENCCFLQPSRTDREKKVISHTSGSTGSGLRFTTTMRAVQEQWAVWWRYRRWHGIQQGIWCGYFGGRSVVPVSQKSAPFWRCNVPGKQILFSGYHLNEKNLPLYLEELRRRRPPWLHGYPSILSLIAAFVLDRGIDLGYQPRWITVGAENLLPQQSEQIEKAFGTRPLQHYGMAEAIANISECELGMLHVDEDFSAVEFLPNPDGEGYRIIGTNFTNTATPFLRYDVHDSAFLSLKNCHCGRPGRVVSRLDGRKEDYVILKNGSRLGRMDHIFKEMVNIREAQIHQKIPGQIVMRIVRGSEFNKVDESMLLRQTYQRVGHETDVQIEYVDCLERTSAGKLRFVVSEVPEGKVGAS